MSDSLTEDPIGQADVQLRTQGHISSSYRGFTDSSGRISFEAVERGNYNLVVEKLDYEPSREGVDVRPGAAEHFSILLVRRPDSGVRTATSQAGPTVHAAALGIPAAAQKEYAAGASLLKDDPAASIRHFQNAIEKYPRYADAYTLLGLAYIRRKQSAEAMSALTTALELNPKLSVAHTLRGKLYREEKNYTQAESDLLESIRLDSQAWDAPYELAFCYYYMGRIDRAVEYAKRARDLPHASSATHLLLVDLYMRQNDREAALHELDEFAKADPNSPMMAKVQQLYKILRDSK